jgi:hypothetical protein
MKEIAVEPWNPDIHLPLLEGWFFRHGKPPHAGDARLYPSTGFLVDQCAVGFLFTTNAPLVGYLDGFVTDPAVSGRRRLRAMERVVSCLEDEAKKHGIELLFAATNVRGLVALGHRAGFASYGTGFDYLVRKVT